MIKDCTEEFKRLDRKIGIFWLAYIGYLTVAAIALNTVADRCEWASLEFNATFLAIAVGMLLVFRFFSPRCPNCGQGLYSLAEIGKYPIIVKTWIGKKCCGCGAKLKT